jgi:hypothetical protein
MLSSLIHLLSKNLFRRFNSKILNPPWSFGVHSTPHFVESSLWLGTKCQLIVTSVGVPLFGKFLEMPESKAWI